jgi:hypothetical protein
MTRVLHRAPSTDRLKKIQSTSTIRPSGSTGVGATLFLWVRTVAQTAQTAHQTLSLGNGL